MDGIRDLLESVNQEIGSKWKDLQLELKTLREDNQNLKEQNEKLTKELIKIRQRAKKERDSYLTKEEQWRQYSEQLLSSKKNIPCCEVTVQVDPLGPDNILNHEVSDDVVDNMKRKGNSIPEEELTSVDQNVEKQSNDNDSYKRMKLKKLHTTKLRYRQHLVDTNNNCKQSTLDSNRCKDATDYVADSIPIIDSQASIDLTMTQPLSPVYRPKKGRLVACNPDTIEEEIKEEDDSIDNDITLSNIRDINDESINKTNSFNVVLDADIRDVDKDSQDELRCRTDEIDAAAKEENNSPGNYSDLHSTLEEFDNTITVKNNGDAIELISQTKRSYPIDTESTNDNVKNSKSCMKTIDQFFNNYGKKPNFKYVETVRKKNERRQLNGHACDLCKKYYSGLGLSEKELQERMKNCSRHRAVCDRPDTPPDFWSTDFPDTQTLIEKRMLLRAANNENYQKKLKPWNRKSY